MELKGIDTHTHLAKFPSHGEEQGCRKGLWQAYSEALEVAEH